MDISKLWESIVGDGHLWGLCGIAAVLGAVGGLVQAMANAKDRAELKDDGWKRAVVGLVAAVAVLYVTKPDSGIAFVCGSLVAGYVGQAILDSLGAKAKLKVSEDLSAERKQALIRSQQALVQRSEEIVRVHRERDAAIDAAELLIGDAPSPARSAQLSTPERVERARSLLNSIRRLPSPPPIGTQGDLP